ncbi:DASH complex subunit Ask1-domain-containing protein [Annulohypoxylon truncatum]|uniref:DASH complex subunit Ask1-domain-containing protein n=1 Tax=Annulohypoxylon truncatum TaxID=327061 RepID=UPI0020086703|nr:DASH complex subunit Ask1-domain-containing protein [Annulohypoxylon truncatum]KAI1205713.1 DASH complex subunit Ask1-domain-containing protein [Annulohypoxylon truncatum]
MSRPGPSAGRSLTLTEELERLEQSITLTLQEIDHNFSKAHRIVTTSILPLVEQYGEHSKAVWEASQFWKQFFEASANVSLSGYEELANDDETTTAEETTLDETTSDYNNTTSEADTTAEPSNYADHHQEHHNLPDDSLLVDTEMSGSTPRPPATKSLTHIQQQNQPSQKPKQKFAGFESPYEKLRRELGGDTAIFREEAQFASDDDDEDNNNNNNNNDDDDDDDKTTDLPTQRTGKLPNMSMTPRSSSLLEPDVQSTARKNKDPLLHRVLDKNYRLQATPHKGVPQPPLDRGFRARPLSPVKDEREARRPGEGDEDRTRRALWTDSPMSSPEMPAPKLRSDLYHMSPVRLGGRGRAGGAGAGAEGPRTPGVSVQTPGTARKTRDVFAEAKDRGRNLGVDVGAKGKAKKDPDEITWDSDDDDDEFGAFSPPKTIQFALPPSKLMQTPAREASKRIVDDILITAGAAPETSSEYSPTLVKMNQDILDDTF